MITAETQLQEQIENALVEFGLEKIQEKTVLGVDKDTHEVVIFNSEFNTFGNISAIAARHLVYKSYDSDEMLLHHEQIRSFVSTMPKDLSV